MPTSRALTLLAFFAASCATAEAKPPAVKPAPPVKILLDDVDYEDAKAALEAQADVQSAAAVLNGKQLAWQRARARLIERNGVDPERGDGWDVDPTTGRLKARRAPQPPVKK